MSQVKHSTNVNDPEACALSKRKLLERVISDILFSILFLILGFYVSLALNLVSKYWKHITLLQLFILFIISSVAVCSLIFVLQSTLEFFKNLLIVHKINSKTVTGGDS